MSAEYSRDLYAKLLLTESFDLWVLLTHTQYAVARCRDMEYFAYDVSPAQASILHTLKLSGGEATMTELANFTMHRQHSVSDIIKKMSKRKLVKKVKRAGNKEFTIVLTDNGRQLFDDMAAISIEMIFETLSPEDRQEFAGVLKKLLIKARKLLGMDYKPLFLRK